MEINRKKISINVKIKISNNLIIYMNRNGRHDMNRKYRNTLTIMNAIVIYMSVCECIYII